MDTKIGISGYGNIGSCLLELFLDNHLNIVGYHSSVDQHIGGVQYFDDVKELAHETDVLFLTVPDSAIAKLSTQLQTVDCLVCHCSGTTSINGLGKIKRKGVFWPLQTFSKNKPITNNFSVFVEANLKDDVAILMEIAQKLNCTAYELPSEKRMLVHLSAVVSGNFTNAVLAEAAKILQQTSSEIPFHVLKPLVEETVKKAFSVNQPEKVQTGPAVRNDEITLDLHKQILRDNHTEFLEVYKTLSDLIMRQKDELF